MSRLEEIKNSRKSNGFFSNYDVEWLIEQAERVKELEEYNELAYNRIVKVEKQNQRYKQALEFYADESNHTEHRGTRIFGDVFYDKGEKARQALEDDTK